MKFLSKLTDKVVGIWSVDISSINRHIFNLPTKGIPYRKELFNKHLQNLVWMFWFGRILHKEDE